MPSSPDAPLRRDEALELLEWFDELEPAQRAHIEDEFRKLLGELEKIRELALKLCSDGLDASGIAARMDECAEFARDPLPKWYAEARSVLARDRGHRLLPHRGSHCRARRRRTRRAASAAASSGGGDPPDGGGHSDEPGERPRHKLPLAVFGLLVLLAIPLGATTGAVPGAIVNDRDDICREDAALDGAWEDGWAELAGPCEMSGEWAVERFTAEPWLQPDDIDALESAIADEVERFRRVVESGPHRVTHADLQELHAVDQAGRDSDSAELLATALIYTQVAGDEVDPIDPDLISEEAVIGTIGSSALWAAALGRLLHEHDPRFIERLRRLGPTPELLAQANHLLNGPDHEQARDQIAARRLPQTRRRAPRARAPRGRSVRIRGSRRCLARCTGPPGDDPDPEPRPALGRSLINAAVSA